MFALLFTYWVKSNSTNDAGHLFTMQVVLDTVLYQPLEISCSYTCCTKTVSGNERVKEVDS